MIVELGKAYEFPAPAAAEAARPVGEKVPAPSWTQNYFKKFRGAGVQGPPRQPLSYSGISWIGSFAGIGSLGLIHTYVFPHITFAPLVMLIGSFGAMAVLVFGQPAAPPSQPWNVICGNTIGGLVGVAMYEVAMLARFADMVWLTGALAVSLTIVCQELTQSQHPPGGATALLFSLMPSLQALHYTYILCPALLGAVIFVILSMAINNISSTRSYPQSVHPFPAAENQDEFSKPQSLVGRYVAKMKGKGAAPMPRPPLTQTCFSWLGSFTGIATLGLIQQYIMPALHTTDVVLLVGSFGAMSVLLYSMPAAPFSQPKNALLGNTLGGVVGIIVVKTCEACNYGHHFWLVSALAVSLTIVAQEQTRSVHPPGGATALIFVLRACAAKLPDDHPFSVADFWDWYFFCPSFLGAAILVGIALLINNVSEKRNYPGRWWS
jgi:CBS-domain-containing membrane protein